MWDVVRILKYSFHLVAGLVFWSLNFKIEERDCSFSQMCRTCNAQQKSRLCHNNVSKSGVLEIMCSAQFIVQASMQWAFTVKWMMSRIHAFLGRIWIKTPLKEFCKTQRQLKTGVPVLNLGGGGGQNKNQASSQVPQYIFYTWSGVLRPGIYIATYYNSIESVTEW